jgi:penicillin-binding protein 2
MKRERELRPVFSRRALLLGTAQVAGFSALGIRLYRMQVLQHGKYATLAKQNSVNERMLAPLRGVITDRTGLILAGNKQHWRALFMMIQAPDPEAVIDQFAHLIPLSPAERTRIAHDIAGKPRYVPVLLKDYLTQPFRVCA